MYELQKYVVCISHQTSLFIVTTPECLQLASHKKIVNHKSQNFLATNLIRCRFLKEKKYIYTLTLFKEN